MNRLYFASYRGPRDINLTLQEITDAGINTSKSASVLLSNLIRKTYYYFITNITDPSKHGYATERGCGGGDHGGHPVSRRWLCCCYGDV